MSVTSQAICNHHINNISPILTHSPYQQSSRAMLRSQGHDIDYGSQGSHGGLASRDPCPRVQQEGEIPWTPFPHSHWHSLCEYIQHEGWHETVYSDDTGLWNHSGWEALFILQIHAMVSSKPDNTSSHCDASAWDHSAWRMTWNIVNCWLTSFVTLDSAQARQCCE